MALKVGELFASFNVDTSGIDKAMKQAKSTTESQMHGIGTSADQAFSNISQGAERASRSMSSSISTACSSAKQSLEDLGKSMMKTGAMLSLTVTTPIVAAAKSVVSTGMDFQAAMSQVYATGGKDLQNNAAAMDALKKKALEMGATTQYTATQAAEGLNVLLMAGYDAVEGFDEVASMLDTVLNMAAAGGIDIEQSASIITNVMATLGDAAGGPEQVADSLAVMATKAKGSVAEFGEALSTVGGQLGVTGQSMQAGLAALGALGNAGYSGAEAGTQLRNVLKNIYQPTTKAQKAMDEFGYSAYDSQGNVKPLGEALKELQGIYDSFSTDVERNQFMDAIFDTRTLAAGKKLMDSAVAGEFDQLLGYMSDVNGAAENMRLVQQDNLRGDIEIMKSAIDGFKQSLFELNQGPLRDVVQNITHLFDKLNGMDDDTKMGLTRLLGLAASMGPALVIGGKLATTLAGLPALIWALSSPLGFASIGMIAFGAAVMDTNNSIGETFEKACHLVSEKSAELKNYLVENGQAIRDRMGEALSSMASGVEEAMTGVSDAGAYLLTFLMDSISQNMDGIVGVGKGFVEGIGKGLKDNIPALVGSAHQLATNFVIGTLNMIPTLVKTGGELALAVVEGLKEVDWGESATKLSEAFKGSMSEIESTLSGFGSKLAELINPEEGFEFDFSTFESVGQNIIDGIISGIRGVTDFSTKVIEAVTEKLSNTDWPQLTEKAKSMGQSIFRGVKQGITSIGDAGVQIVTAIGDLITSEGFADAFTSAGDIAGDIINGIIDSIVDIADAGTRIMEAIGGFLTPDNIGNAFDAIGSVAESIVSAISSGISDNKDTVVDIMRRIGDVIFGSEGESGLLENALSGGANLATQILSAITDGISGISTFAADIFDAIASSFTSENAEGIAGAAENLLSSIITGITDVLDAAANGDATDHFVSFMNQLGTALMDGIASIDWSGLGDKFGNLVTTLVQGLIKAIPGVMAAVENGMSVGMKLASGLLEGIRSAIDTIGTEGIGSSIGQMLQSVVESMVRLAPQVIDVVKDGLSLGAQLAESLFSGITSAIQAMADSGVGSSIGTLLNTLITGLISTLPGIMDAADSALSLGMQLANSLIDGIGDAITQISAQDIGGSIGDVLNKLISGLIEKLPDAMNMIQGGLSLGTKMVSAILEGIGSALGSASADGNTLGTNIGKLATDLVRNILDGIKNIPESDAYKSFVTNLGEGIRGALGELGKLAGEIVSYIFSPEGIQAIWNAGLSLGKMLIDGIKSAVEGIGSFFSNLVNTMLINYGVISSEQAKEASSNAANVLKASLESGLQEGTAGYDMAAIMSALLKSNPNVDIDESTFDAPMQAYVEALQGAINKYLNDGPDNGGDLRDTIRKVLTDSMNETQWDFDFSLGMGEEASEAFWASLEEALGKPPAERQQAVYDLLSQQMNDLMGNAMDAAQDAADSAGETIDLSAAVTGKFAGLSGETQSQIQAACEELGIKASELMSQEISSGIMDAIKNASGQEEIKTLISDLFNGSETEARQEGEGIGQAATDGAKDKIASLADAPTEAINGMQTTLDNAQGTIGQAGENLANSAVQKVIEKMNAEAGGRIATEYVNGIKNTLNDGSAAQAASAMANSAVAAAKGVMTYTAGLTLGQQFGKGIADGIRSMADTISQAARSATQGALNTVKSTQDSGSPSRITTGFGADFGQGYANGILGMMGTITKASRSVTDSAINTLRETQKSHSPSAVTTNEGINWGQGYTNGIAATEKSVAKAALKITKVANNTLKENSGGQNAYLNRNYAEINTSTSATGGGSIWSGLEKAVTGAANDSKQTISKFTEETEKQVQEATKYIRKETTKSTSIPVSGGGGGGGGGGGSASDYMSSMGPAASVMSSGSSMASASSGISQGAVDAASYEQYARIVAAAINGCHVELDGQEVGVLVASTVSETIAESASARRNGTI